MVPVTARKAVPAGNSHDCRIIRVEQWLALGFSMDLHFWVMVRLEALD